MYASKLTLIVCCAGSTQKDCPGVRSESARACWRLSCATFVLRNLICRTVTNLARCCDVLPVASAAEKLHACTSTAPCLALQRGNMFGGQQREVYYIHKNKFPGGQPQANAAISGTFVAGSVQQCEARIVTWRHRRGTVDSGASPCIRNHSFTAWLCVWTDRVQGGCRATCVGGCSLTHLRCAASDLRSLGRCKWWLRCASLERGGRHRLVRASWFATHLRRFVDITGIDRQTASLERHDLCW